MKTILVCGSWGSGTTAVAGVLDRLGFTGFGPYYHTNDVRTPNSYELVPFRSMVLSLASEFSLSLTESSAERIGQAVQGFRQRILDREFGPCDPQGDLPVFLKYPLSALLLPQICQCFDTRLIVVTRPLQAIEATRRRRNWPGQYGEAGAKVLYSRLFSAFVELGLPAHFVHYPQLVKTPEPLIRAMAEYCGRVPDDRLVSEAVRFISHRTLAREPGPRVAAASAGRTGCAMAAN